MHLVARGPGKQRGLPHRRPANPHEIELHVPFQWPFTHVV